MPFPDARITLAALIVEAAVGYPAWLHRRLPHPVVWIGALIGGLEARLNQPRVSEAARRLLGVLVVLLLIGLAGGAGWLIQSLPAPGWAVAALTIACATTGLAQRSLHDHVAAVLSPLLAGDIPAARAAVAGIVGRDVERLDASGVATAAVESLAESFNDGIVAPAFWLVVGGLPGLLVYKAINTADSMIGHREPRWRAFGWAAARTDDLMNLIPARLAGALICLVGGRGWRTMVADAPHHASPNAGWPEAAMAGALGVRLGGPAWYDGVIADRPVFGRGAPPTPADLGRGLRLYRHACLLLWGIVAAVAGLEFL